MMIPLTQRTEAELTSMLVSERLQLSNAIYNMAGMGMWRNREYYLANRYECYCAEIRNGWAAIFAIEHELESRTLSATV
jgi:hypothetical protein